MKTSEALRKARNKIANPRHWTQYVLARGKAGELVQPESDKAVCWCAVGAVRSVAAGRSRSMCLYYLELMVPFREVALYNDSRTHNDVMNMFNNAIEEAQNDGD